MGPVISTDKYMPFQDDDTFLEVSGYYRYSLLDFPMECAFPLMPEDGMMEAAVQVSRSPL